MRTFFAGLAAAVLFTIPMPLHAAETFVAQQLNAVNRLTPLKKITVGPDDQYQASLDSDGKTLVFTRKSDLVPHLCAQDLESGETFDFLPLSADSQEANVSPKGQVAFTYYKFTARGDICYKKLELPETRAPREAQLKVTEQKFPCLKSDDLERSSPFWKGPNELGYLSRNAKTQVAQVVVENLETGAKQVLAEGKIWSPTVKPGGHYLVYNELVATKNAGGTGDYLKRELVLTDLQTGTKRILKFALPGISGFPTLSDDEKYLYFSHYLNDTNNDNVIDGNDNSVVFRAPLGDLLAAETFFPEQLTSAESNCSLPKTHGEDLYVTCAFEGNLDIYRIPQTGIVPMNWGEPLLNSAHQTSRTYQERILILNSMKYRLKGLNGHELDVRLFGDHLLAEDTSSAKYYLSELQKSAAADQKGFYELMRVYLNALERKQQQPSAEEISRDFRNAILGFDGELEKIAGQKRLKIILHGLFASFLNQPPLALNYLKQVAFDDKAQVLERYLYFDLASWTLPRSNSEDGLVRVYRQMMGAPELSKESQLYYAFRLLEYLQDTEPSRASRVVFLSGFNHDFPDAVKSLIQSEMLTLKLIEAKDEAAKMAVYRDLDNQMSASAKDYFLRKALYIRSILNFADAAEFKFLTFIATNWVRYTTNDDTEFSYSREVFVNSALDRAYDTFGQKEYELAGNYFYSSLTMTDDLESHYGYIHSMATRGQRKTIDERYDNLVKRNMIGDNRKFVQAVLKLIDNLPGDEAALDDALSLLLAMEQDRDSAVRYLLLGYVYLEKLVRSADGYDFDHELFENAHRSLMLAYDIGRDNDRVKASALMNLGLLHQRSENHGLAVKFFIKRKELGFVSPQEKASFAWVYARSLFFNHQPALAATQLEDVEAPSIAIKERIAFYQMSAGDFGKASAAYDKLIESGQIKADLNLAKVRLGQGFSLFQQKRLDAARGALLQSLAHSERLASLGKGKNRHIDFEPIRLRLIAYGLLGRIGDEVSRLEALEKRGALLMEAKDKGLFEDSLSLLIQNRVQVAKLIGKSDTTKAAARLQTALQYAEDLQGLQPLSHAIYQCAVDYLAYGYLNPAVLRKFDSDKIKKLVDKTLQTYQSQKSGQVMLDFQRTKLKLLWTAYENRVRQGNKVDKDAIRQILDSVPNGGRAFKPLADALTNSN